MAKNKFTPTREWIVDEVENLKLLAECLLPKRRKKMLFFKTEVSPNGNVKTSFVVVESEIGLKKEVRNPILRTYSSIDFALQSYDDIS